MKLITRSTCATKTVELMDWAAQYEQNDLYPQKDPQRRFGIGLYQIFQGMKWEKGAVANEAYASCALHMFLCAGLLKSQIELILKPDLIEYDYDHELHCDQLLFFISRAQQMIIYGRYRKSKNYDRKSRFDPLTLAHDLSCIIIGMMMAIPSLERAQAIEDASAIMTGRL